MNARVSTPATRLLDTLIAENQLKNDAALSRFLDIGPPVISKVRYGKLRISGDTIILIHEKTGKSIADIKAALAA